MSAPKSLVGSLIAKIFLHMEAAARLRQGVGLRDENLGSVAMSCRFGPNSCLNYNNRDKININIDHNCAIFGEVMIFPRSGQIKIGHHCFIGAGTRIWSAANISIGNYVLISHNVNIHDNISHSLNWRERREELHAILPSVCPYPNSFDLHARPIVIEDDAWIGCNAIVLGGVRIGRGAVIGAGAVVTKNVPDFTIAVGNPLRFVRALN